MLYELRLYTVVAGRMEDNHDRFQDHMPGLMARHGISNVGRWTATAGPNAPMFVYMMVYPDMTAREAQWTSFYGDDEWWAVRAATNAGSQMVERFDLFFLKSNPCWTAPAYPAGTRSGGVHELIFTEVALGHGADANAFLTDTLLPLYEREGATPLMVADFMSGPAMPRIAMIVAWPDENRRHAGRRAIDSDPGLRAAQRDERERLNRTALGRTDVYVLEPTAFDLPLASLSFEG
ncbi:NIPSNAP family protein [Sphingomonas sp. MG17]|uniref:NIPSNAP family protein n=1 Tax=Sphingomonas tagetis TaxID=2949092 RepID=A0A9X2HJP1_9SPHN|nr:NIPSNAP family protein [Sphingomonas tagetis]MCP3730334.1 NIPSNAP family protein [Sphingomonas tagetis]